MLTNSKAQSPTPQIGHQVLWVHRYFSFKLRGLENAILARVLFLFQERTSERPLAPFWIPLCVSVHKSTSHNMKSKHLWKISMASSCFSLPIALLVFTCGRWRRGVLSAIQSLPHPDFGCVTRFPEWFCVRPSFLFSPCRLPDLKSPLP